MMAQVIYLNKVLNASSDELRRNENLQIYINSARAGMENRIKNYHPFDKMIERQKFNNYFREKIKQVKQEHS